MATCGLVWATWQRAGFAAPEGSRGPCLPDVADYPRRERYYKPSAYTVHLRYSTRGWT